MLGQSEISPSEQQKQKEFKWARVMDEMKEYAPTLLNVLLSCTNHSRSNQTAIVCFIASILFKFRYAKMNLFQKILSLILYAGHCGKQVIPIIVI